MSRTDHSRRAKNPEHADLAPKFTPRPEPRRSRTRRQALLRLLTSGSDAAMTVNVSPSTPKPSESGAT